MESGFFEYAPVNRIPHYVPKGIVDSPIKLLLGDIFQHEKSGYKKPMIFQAGYYT